jgi:protein involved in temperature-dependent protein secretion
MGCTPKVSLRELPHTLSTEVEDAHLGGRQGVRNIAVRRDEALEHAASPDDRLVHREAVDRQIPRGHGDDETETMALIGRTDIRSGDVERVELEVIVDGRRRELDEANIVGPLMLNHASTLDAGSPTRLDRARHSLDLWAIAGAV